MKFAFAVIGLFPTVLIAETFPLESDVTSATLYPQGATLVREVPYSIPAGKHELVLTDLPRGTPLELVRVELSAGKLGSVTGRTDFVPPRDEAKSAEIEAAEGEVERLESALRVAEQEVLLIRVEIDGTNARVEFLKKLGAGETTAGKNAAELQALALMIDEQTLAARRAAHEAHFRAGEADRALKDLREDLDKARQTLAALQTGGTDYAMLSVTASADAPVTGVMKVSYLVNSASWQPIYDMRLDKDAGKLSVERGAFIGQYTGEDWGDVKLTLSTVRPSQQVEPREIFAWQRSVTDPQVALPKSRVQVEASSLSKRAVSDESVVAGAPMEEPVFAGATASYDGLAVTYDYPERVNVANRADNLRITLGEVTTDANVQAFAAPLYDETGFLMASITNDMGELILPSSQVSLFLDGRFVGQTQLADVIPVGGEADIPFGAIDGLRLKRTVKSRNEGDRGMISRSTELSEEVTIEVENLTGETWPVQVFDRVPFSEQEELEISYIANPRPSVEDYDDKRGVLQWSFDLKPGATQSISLKHELEWPEGKVLK
ncbi:DUF4139 domain-containing protein [Lentibacter algarum]|uniref:DUF4139 domain-containing protein n=1 Tax=Lentibacter algarum TaxID=576131 RepID=UPI001C0677CB|nr:DUF4139 domain-containing protein [Lentibacter algarum]MBU2981584.1 DUF4139 domain-containing protein [Lentibacter algarum]